MQKEKNLVMKRAIQNESANKSNELKIISRKLILDLKQYNLWPETIFIGLKTLNSINE